MKELGEKCKICICRDCVNSHKYFSSETEVCNTFCEEECCGGTKSSLNNYNECEFKEVYIED